MRRSDREHLVQHLQARGEGPALLSLRKGLPGFKAVILAQGLSLPGLVPGLTGGSETRDGHGLGAGQSAQWSGGFLTAKWGHCRAPRTGTLLGLGDARGLLQVPRGKSGELALSVNSGPMPRGGR